MRKFSLSFFMLLFITLFTEVQINAQVGVIPPTADGVYYIRNMAGDFYLTGPKTGTGSGNITIQSLASGEDATTQHFKFIEAQTVDGQVRYKIQVQSGDKPYAGKKGNYDTEFSSTGTEFWLKTLANGNVGIYNAGANNGLGVDNATNGAKVYSDKAGAARFEWLIYSVDISYEYALLQMQILAAQNTLSSLAEYPEAFYRPLSTKIEEAKAIDKGASNEIINAARTELTPLNTGYTNIASALTTANGLLLTIPNGLKQSLQNDINTILALTDPTLETINTHNTSLRAKNTLFNSLVGAIAEAEKVYNQDGQFDPEAKAALAQSIETAKAISDPSDTAINAVIADLKAKKDAYLATETQPVFTVNPTKKYRIAITDENGQYIRYISRKSETSNQVIPKQKDLYENPDLQLFYFELKEGSTNEYYIKNVSSDQYATSGPAGNLSSTKESYWVPVYNKYVNGEPYFRFNRDGKASDFWCADDNGGIWPDAIPNMWTGKSNINNARLFRVEEDFSTFQKLQILIEECEDIVAESTNPAAVKTYMNNAITTAKAVQDGNEEIILSATETLLAQKDVFTNYAQALTEAKNAIGLSGDFPKENKLALEAAISAAESNSSSTEADIKAIIENLKTKTQEYIDSKIVPVFKPKADVQYRLYAVNDANGTGQRIYFGSHNDWNCGAKVLAFEFVDNQVQLYTFVESEDQPNSYLIKSTKSQKAIRTNGHTDPGVQETPFLIQYAKTKNGVDYYTLQMTVNGKYLGFGSTNPTAMDAYISDMSTISSYPTEEKYFWSFEEDVVTLKRELLAPVINQAALLYNTTEEGTEGGQYPADKREEFNNAIKTAQALSLNEQITDGQIIKDGVETLNAAIAAYKASVVIPVFEPEAGASYRIGDPTATIFFSDSIASERVRTQAFTVKATGVESNQQWTIEKVADTDGAYIIKNPAGKVLTYTNKKDDSKGFTFEDLKADGTESTTQYVKIEYAYFDNGRNHFFITTYEGEKRTIARNNTSASSYLQVKDLDATNTTNQPVIFVKVENPDLNKFALEKAIRETQAFLDGQSIGTSTGEYPESAKEALQQAIDNAQNVYNTAADQTAVDDAIAPLAEAKAAFQNQIIVDIETYRNVITTRIQLYKEAEVSPAIGDYYQSAIDALRTAVDKALTIYQRGYVTKTEKEELDAAAAAFTAAKNATQQEVLAVLNDAITADQTFLTNTGEEGTGYGQPAAGSKAIFQTAINTATTVAEKPDATEDELSNALKALNEARKTFEDGFGDWDYTQAYLAVEDANTIMAARAENEGEFNGKYPTSAYDELQNAIDVVNYFLGLPASNQEEINDTTAYLRNSITTFEASKIVIDFSALSALVAEAEAYMATIVAVPGSNLESSLATFESAVVTAKGFIDAPDISQDGVDEEVIKLNNAVLKILDALKKPDLENALKKATAYSQFEPAEDETAIKEAQAALVTVIEEGQALMESDQMSVVTQEKVNATIQSLTEKTNALITAMSKKLSDLVTEAKAMAAAATEGTGEGKHTAAEITAFNAAITTAEGVLNSQNSYYDHFNLAYNNLLPEVITFASKDLKERIASVEKDLSTAVEGDKVGQYEVGSKKPLEDALAAAKEALEEGTEKDFSKFYQDAYNTLKAAHELFLSKVVTETGIDVFSQNGIYIYSSNGKLYVTGLTEEVNITGYDMSGRSVFTEQATGDYSRDLTQGNYIISIQGYVNGNTVVMIK